MWLLFRYSFRISRSRPVILNEVFCGFLQCFQANAGIVAQIRIRPLPSVFFPIYFSVLYSHSTLYNLTYSVVRSPPSSSLSNDRLKASAKTIPPHIAIQSFLLQMRVSSFVLKVIQQLLTSSFLSACHFHLPFCLSFSRLF